MYLARNVIARIDSTLKLKGVTKIKMCNEIGINKNTINSMTDKKGISSFDLAKIADYLGVSVDYLLGRETKQPVPLEIKRSELISVLSKMSESELDEFLRYGGYLIEKKR